MKREELIPLITQAPFLALDLMMLSDEHLQSVSVYKPDTPNKPVREFDHFCDTLNIPRKPFLVVASDEVLGDKMRARAAFDPLTRAIYVRASDCDKFSRKGSFERYVLAHEIGHASDKRLSRRAFLSLSAPLALYSVASGSLITSAIDDDTVSVTDTVKLGAAALALCATFKLMLATHSQFIPSNEHEADARAAEILGANDILQTLAEACMEDLEWLLPEEEIDALKNEHVAAIKAEIGAEGVNAMSQSERTLAFALFAASELDQKYELSKYLRTSNNPSNFERIKYVQESGRGR